jgi:hypothetical protein
MKAIVNIALFFSVLLSFSGFACSYPNGSAFQSIAVDGGAIVFEYAPIEKELPLNGGPQEKGIDVGYYSCSGALIGLIGQLPYLADTGKVRDAFLYGTSSVGGKKLFVIHSVEVRSDTGVKYLGDYYSVNVYGKDGDSYVRDDHLSDYFGAGGDILADDYEQILYTFPYKSEKAILDKLNSESYKKWLAGTPVKLVINKKAPIYSSPVLSDVTRMYLIAGDTVSQEAVEAGWLSIVYKTSKGTKIRGWIQCENANGC